MVVDSLAQAYATNMLFNTNKKKKRDRSEKPIKVLAGPHKLKDATDDLVLTRSQAGVATRPSHRLSPPATSLWTRRALITSRFWEAIP